MAKILLADDEHDVVTLLRFLLEKEGHSIDEAYSGTQVLAKLGVDGPARPAARPDLIVLDVMMPGADGYTVARRLADEDRTKGIPIVILTAKGGMRDLFGFCANIAEYMQKPFDPATLRDVVAKTLQAKKN